MRAGGDDAAQLEAARLRLVDEEEDRCNRGCQRGARAAATTDTTDAACPLLPAALFRRGPIRVDTMSSRRSLPFGSFASSWSPSSQTR